jgi:CheY-like chemotaxis protein
MTKLEELERLAGRIAYRVNHLVSGGVEEECADLVAELTRELLAFRSPETQHPEFGLPARGTAAWAAREGAETILLVDGEPEDRVLVRDILLRQGRRVLEAGCGRQALEICGRGPEAIHVMLTNVLLPDMGGRELAERAALLRPGMAVIYMSGYTDDEIVFYGVLGPAVATLQKPVKGEALAAKLSEALETHGASLVGRVP